MEKDKKKKLNAVRKGQRVVALSAIMRNGSGAHVNRKDKRKSNRKNDWDKEWE